MPTDQSDSDTSVDINREINVQNSSATRIPMFLQVASDYTWRILILLIGIIALYKLALKFETVAIPFTFGLLFTALLLPLVDALHRRNVPRSLASAGALLVLFLFIVLLVLFIVLSVAHDFDEFQTILVHRIDSTRQWLIKGPLKLSADQINEYAGQIVNSVGRNKEQFFKYLPVGALNTVSFLAEFGAGVLLTIFITAFLIYDGAGVWRFATLLVAKQARVKVQKAGAIAFHSLIAYVRATATVAAVDAIGIGVGVKIVELFFGRIPLIAPLCVLVFLGAFIPVVGAFITGGVAVIVVLISVGFIPALITLFIIVAVMQFEGHVLQPFLLGRAVNVHPLAVILGIAIGGVLLGVWGALIAVPIIAVINSFVRALKIVENSTTENHLSTVELGDTPVS